MKKRDQLNNNRAALSFFRAGSYLKSIRLHPDDTTYLIRELFEYYYSRVEYYRLLDARRIRDANQVAAHSVHKMANVVSFMEGCCYKYANEHLPQLFDNDEWRMYVASDFQQPKNYQSDEDEQDE